MRTRAAFALLAVLAALAVRPAAARADDDDAIVPRAMAFAERGLDLVASVGFPDLLDADAHARIASGLPVTVVVRLFVHRQADDLPVAFTLVEREIVYDIWDEVYLVRTRDRAGTRTARYRDRAAAVAAIGRVDALPSAPLHRLPVGALHVAMLIVDLNPVSDALQAEMRRWLVQPADGRGAGSSFFGSFVSVFVNPRLGASDRTLRLRSQPFYRTGARAP